jgi:hypothetical protein
MEQPSKGKQGRNQKPRIEYVARIERMVGVGQVPSVDEQPTTNHGDYQQN